LIVCITHITHARPVSLYSSYRSGEALVSMRPSSLSSAVWLAVVCSGTFIGVAHYSSIRAQRDSGRTKVTWLILPVVICLSQRKELLRSNRHIQSELIVFAICLYIYLYGKPVSHMYIQQQYRDMKVCLYANSNCTKTSRH
jgi:hypothetical protein